MKIITLTREPQSWKYRTQDGALVAFQVCTLGKYKGNLFMSVASESSVYSEKLKKEIKQTKEMYLLKVTKEIRFHDDLRVFGNGTVRVLEEIEVDEKRYSREEVFYNMSRAAKFAIEDGAVHLGYTFNQDWNGWECPYFTKETALEICKEWDDCYYDEETDTFYMDGDNGKEKIGPPTEINTPNGILKVYDFGYSGWIWREVEERQEESEESEC